METHESNQDPIEQRDHTRRRFLVSLGWGSLALVCGGAVPMVGRFLWPRSRHGELDAVEVGTPSELQAETVTSRWIQRHGLWIVSRDGRLFALEARCTHLGCTPRWTPDEGVFHCPCHGSRFSTEGVALNGPATLPLRRLAIRIEDAVVVVDRNRRAGMEEAERDPRFFVRT